MANVIIRMTEEEHDEVRRRAAARGMTIQDYGKAQLGLDRDETREAFIAATHAAVRRFASILEPLDEELAARPRSHSSELGFDPAVLLAKDAA